MRSNRHLCMFAIVVVSLLAPKLALAANPKPVPIVLDTDIGTDIDDAFALALVLKSPELDLRAVTTVSGDTQARARLAAKMLSVAGWHDIPVAAGVPGARLNVAQTRWADGFSSPSLLKIGAVQLMKREIDRAHGQIVIIAIGPLTNVASLFEQYPAEKRKVRHIVLMGGSVARGYSPGSAAAAEYNIASDAKAAQAVFAARVSIEMAPLDITAQLQLDAAHRQRIFAQRTPLS
ncbi:MAG: nucleoside hydrolase, partial [Terracidiphilus sp.]